MDSPQQSQPAFISLLALPNELLFMIADYLGDDYTTFASLARTCRALNPVATYLLYTLDAKSTNPTVLAWGALTGNLECMELAIQHGAPRELNSFSYGLRQTGPSSFLRHVEFSENQEKILWGTALHFAALSNQVAAAELLIEAGAGFYERSFGLCSMSGYGEACSYSLESCPAEFFPMHTAVCYGHRDMIKLFLRHHASLFYITDKMEDDAGGSDVELSQQDPAEDGMPQADWHEISQDVLNEWFQEVEGEEAPEDPEWQSEDEDPGTPQVTALHIAASLGRTDLVEFLAGESGISVNATDCDGRCPLHYAAHAVLKHPRAVIRKLVQMGARLDAQDDIDYDLINFNTEKLAYLLHAALTPAALHGPGFENVSVANLAGTSHSRQSLSLDRSYRASPSSGLFKNESDMDLPSRQELVRVLVKHYGVDVNSFLPSIQETPVTLLALRNASSSDMLRSLIDVGADITKTNGNGETAIHCAMRLYASNWDLLDETAVYGLDPLGEFERFGVDESPDGMLCSLLAAWPADKFNAVNKDGINVLRCIFDSVSWENRRYIDLATFVNQPANYGGLVPGGMPLSVGINEKIMRLNVVDRRGKIRKDVEG
ncbi:ankyrin repeat-containing domain protein [Pseudoneurospora amorphoporcata]|uniref:Ankyrin repeat-containing domain protein n=1 Tax=Pseudoneurospora amorphoporcata TaxID=241081 RepID=A0AAN6SER8_9PEZI|nr:ankyrin repeat-containing domain protein [Pseudoneurospora amorphoporcata]